MASFIRTRVQSLDILRGAVMVIMALDHVRDFFYNPSGSAQSAGLNPTDLATYISGIVFYPMDHPFLRTYLPFSCRHVGIFNDTEENKKELSGFLFKRGLWLIAMEMLVVTLAISFNPLYNILFLQVIWAIGCSMVIMSVMVLLPFRVIFGIGLAIVFLHNTLNFVNLPKNALVDMLYSALFSFYQYAPQRAVIFVYGIIPWSGIMMLGYCFGKLYMPDVSVDERKTQTVGNWARTIGVIPGAETDQHIR
jgi:uncharacterized membrane protein